MGSSAIIAADMEFCRNANRSKNSSPENARVQEDAASADLPDLEHNSAQLCPLVGHLAHLLLRVRGPFMGNRKTGEIQLFLYDVDSDKSL